jgi:hypothetical protein
LDKINNIFQTKHGKFKKCCDTFILHHLQNKTKKISKKIAPLAAIAIFIGPLFAVLTKKQLFLD